MRILCALREYRDALAQLCVLSGILGFERLELADAYHRIGPPLASICPAAPPNPSILGETGLFQ